MTADQPPDPYGQPQQFGPSQYGQRPLIPTPAMNTVPQASTTGGRRARPPAELIVSAVLWLGFGLFNVAMSIVYFVQRAELPSPVFTAPVMLVAFLFLITGLVVLFLVLLVFQGVNAGRLALPPIGLLIILLITNAAHPLHAEWIIAAVAVLSSVLLFLPRANNYVAAMALYG